MYNNLTFRFHNKLIILAKTFIYPESLNVKIIIIRVFCPRAGPSLQAQEPRLQFCRSKVFHRKLRNQGCCFTKDWIDAVASRCFPHPTLSLASEQTSNDLKRSQGHQHGGEESENYYTCPKTSNNLHIKPLYYRLYCMIAKLGLSPWEGSIS